MVMLKAKPCMQYSSKLLWLSSIMLLTRANLELLGKEELVSMFFESYEKLNDNVTQLTNQLAQVDKAMKRMESQLAVSNSVNEAFQNQIISLERQCWKNE